MPPLPHTLPDEPFDIFKSKALGWLISQPDILNYLWEQIRQSGYVTYDSENGKWHGIERMGMNAIFYADDTADGDTPGEADDR